MKVSKELRLLALCWFTVYWCSSARRFLLHQAAIVHRKATRTARGMALTTSDGSEDTFHMTIPTIAIDETTTPRSH